MMQALANLFNLLTYRVVLILLVALFSVLSVVLFSTVVFPLLIIAVAFFAKPKK